MTSSATLFILGGAGDLAGRLLIPGAATFLDSRLDASGTDPDTDLQIVGVGRDEAADYAEFVYQSVLDKAEIGGADTAETVARRLADGARYLSADATDPDELSAALGSLDPSRRLIIYLALPPAVTSASIDALAQVGLPEGTVIGVEKPIGVDASSAAELEEKLASLVDDDHLYRVDHFLQESAVNSLIGLLSLNQPFAQSFHNGAVERIDVVYEESLALEGRAEFYDANGAARDMLQSHLLQVAAHLLAVGGTASVAELLAATTAAPERARRARYTEGEIDGQRIPSYVDEKGVDPSRGTETLAQVELAVDTDRWRGVPITLRSGKAIGDPTQRIEVTYKPMGDDERNGTLVAVDFGDQLEVTLLATAGYGPQSAEALAFTIPLRESVLTPYARVVRALVTGQHRREVPAGTAALAWDVLQPALDAFEEGLSLSTSMRPVRPGLPGGSTTRSNKGVTTWG